MVWPLYLEHVDFYQFSYRNFYSSRTCGATYVHVGSYKLEMENCFPKYNHILLVIVQYQLGHHNAELS